jgi:hypothetical protein
MIKQSFFKIFFGSLLILLSNNQIVELERIELGELDEFTFGAISDFLIYEDAIFISDSKSTRLYKFSLKGKLLKTAGSEGRGPGEFEMGPRLIAAANNRIYANSISPWLHIFDSNLDYIENKEIIKSALNLHDITSDGVNLMMAATQFYKEDIFIYQPKSNSTNSIELDFKLEPGLLSKFDLLKVGDNWLVAWRFKNEFRLYTSSFGLIKAFKIDTESDYAPGSVEKIRKIPAGVSSHQREAYSLGTFTPTGTLFTAFIPLDESTFFVQLGTEGGLDKCLILNVSGKIIQEFVLPSKTKVLLGYKDGVLFMKDRKTEKVEAWKLS